MATVAPQRIRLTSKHPTIGAGRQSHGVDGFVTFDVGSQYKVLETIGSGAYGVVCSAIDTKTENHVAIKKIINPFDVVTTAKRTLRELKLLLHFKHDNVVGIKNIVQSCTRTCKDVYLVMDLMETDLHNIIRSEQPLSAEHICYFLYQLLRGLKYIHSANVIHRDLKPSNLLVNENCELKIGDFGMARGVSSGPEDQKFFMTEYVATRWYRAPELMLSVGEYSQSIDIWSVGCIFAEMMGRKQLFPGRHYVHQLQLVISVLGSPTEELVRAIRSDRVRRYVQSLPHKDPVTLKSLYPKASDRMLDLLASLLKFDPAKRPTADQALDQSFFKGYHDREDEPLCHAPFDFRFEATVTKDDVSKQVAAIIEQYQRRKSRFSKQLIVVSTCPLESLHQEQDGEDQTNRTASDVFKKPPAPINSQKMQTKAIAAFEKSRKSRENDVDMKSASSVCSMDLSIEIEAKAVQKVLNGPFRPEGAVAQSDATLANVANQPMITVHVVQDEDPEPVDKNVASKEKSKQPPPSKKNAGQPKKGTISEDTKMKIRDTIFASMFAKQKGLGKPLEKVRKSVTAAERQREREEKRRKRQERAAEKEKKKREEEAANKKKELSAADRSLLERWTEMQKSSKDGPDVDSTSAVDRNETNLPSKQGATSGRKALNRHKSLPPSSSNPFKRVQREPEVKRWSINEPSFSDTEMRPNVFAHPVATNVKIAGRAKPAPSSLAGVKALPPQQVPGAGHTTYISVCGNQTVNSSRSNILHFNVQSAQPTSSVTFTAGTTSVIGGKQGFIPDPSFVDDKATVVTLASTQPSQHDHSLSKSTCVTAGKFENDGGGVFIPETDLHAVTSAPGAQMTTSVIERPTTLFSARDGANLVLIENQVMTPGKASMQACMTTPTGKNLISLSPDTIDFVLDQELNKRPNERQQLVPIAKHKVLFTDDKTEFGRVGKDATVLSSVSSSSHEGAVTLSPGGTSLVFRSKKLRQKNGVPLYGTEKPGSHADIPFALSGDAVASEERIFGGKSVSSIRAVNCEDRHSSPAQGAVMRNATESADLGGGVFVPLIDDSPSLNAHHYGPIAQNDSLPSAGAASSTGEGYGLGVTIEDIIPPSAGDQSLSMQFSATSDGGLDPCSSSLLRDWLDVRCLNPEDMEALQKELELGSPMSVDGESEKMK